MVAAETTEACTEAELREAGASATYIAYYLTAKEMGIDTPSTRHAEKVVFEGADYSGGGFHDSLWNNEPRWGEDNPYGADTKNQRILAEAGVSPYKPRP